MNTPEKKATDAVYLKGKRVVLKPLNEAYVPHLTVWINDPEVRQFLLTRPPRTDVFEREWVAELSKKSETDIVLVIETLDHIPIGVMGIHGINWLDRIATTGAFIGEKAYWGKGYGTDAKMVLLEHAFNSLNLRKIQSRVIAFNKRSLAYSLHCGYKVEGRLRSQIFRDGRYWDEILLGLFKEDWLPYWKKYQSRR